MSESRPPSESSKSRASETQRKPSSEQARSGQSESASGEHGRPATRESRELQRPAGSEPMLERLQSPFAAMLQLSDEMSRLMDTLFGRDPWLARDPFFGRRNVSQRRSIFGDGDSSRWAPQIEVCQEGNAFVVCADLPGVKPDDVKLEVEEDQLVICGERREEREASEEGWRRSERSYGSFYRAIPLPDGAKPDSAQATMRDGVLELKIPLEPPAQPRRIQIQAS
jgi:HSP20 family protein